MSLTMTEGILSLDTENMNDSGISFLYDQLKDLVYKDSSNFNPHSKQLDFMSSPERGRIILGGNQSGKSLVGTIEALCHATGKKETYSGAGWALGHGSTSLLPATLLSEL